MTKVTECRFVETSLDGSEAQVPAVVLAITLSDFEDLLAAYNPSSGTSPPVADCRPTMRAILDAILAARAV